MSKAGNLLGIILDLGKQMLISGAEVWRVEDILNDLFETYCFKTADIYITSACIEATVQTWDGRVYTQIRGISGMVHDLDKLERLCSLADEIRRTPVGVDTVRKRLNGIIARPGLSVRDRYLASVIASVGFAVLFGGGVEDAVVSAVNALLLAYLSLNFIKSMNNKLAGTIISAAAMEIVTLFAMTSGILDRIAPVTIAGIFMLISSMGIINGIGELMHGNTISSVIELSSSVLGALGIAIGISIAMLPFRESVDALPIDTVAAAVSNPTISVISCSVGCLGFAILMGAKGKALLYSTIGAALTQCVYMLVYSQLGTSVFIATMQSACFVALYALLIRLVTKIPGAVFRIACILPLLPGSNLYYAVLGATTLEPELFRTNGTDMLLIAAAIGMGFITVDAVVRLIRSFSIKMAGRV